MTREEGKEFANALKNNYTINFDKLPEFCDLVISALEKNERAEEWYKLLCEKWDSFEEDTTMEWHWTNWEDNDYECSQCHGRSSDLYDFCPHCGRKAVFK